MKRNILKAWGIVLTAGMLIGGNGSGIVQAAEAQGSQSEVNTYQSESASTEEGTESGAEASGEEGGMAASGESEASASGEESKAPAETADSTESEAPAETVRPSESSAPVETVKPSESEAPVETVRPSESKAPVETVKPSESQAPEETVKPSSKPSTPEETAKPSSKPSAPGETAKPSSKPSTPGETVKPSSKPGTPEETVKPSSKPSTPEETAKPSSRPGTPEETVKPSSKPSTPEETAKPSSKPSVPEGTAKPAASVKPEEGSQEVLNGWKEEDGKYYWYVEGVKQGTEEADEEIYDPEAEAWYLLDSTDNGARVVDKAVYLETDGGKWVRYDVDGKRVQGEYSVDGQEYYYEPFTGAMVKGPMVLSDGRKVFYDLETGQMVKGECEINEVTYHFDEKDGHLIEEAEPEFWLEMEEGSYWYKDWVRQGWKPENPEYIGEEVYDAVSEEWCWLDGTEQGRLAVNKLVYLENSQADKEGNLGKWVFYDENGHMFKGWTEDGMYYYDPIYGTMARGTVTIGNKQYEFDNETGLKLSEKVISGFEMYGLECNAEAGVEYDYATACYDVQRLRTVGKTVFDYKTFESDESHPAKDGYEWKQVTVSMTYSDISAQYFGYQYAVLFGLDYYYFSNAAVESFDSNGVLDQGNVIEFEGKTYDISTHYEVLADGWNEDGVAQTVILYECQVPVGYDGMTIALYNAANIDNGETALERMDENSLIFRMQ